MKTIRNNTFETNSSSSHSITIGGSITRPKINMNGESFVLTGGEFGWGYEEYSDPLTKINYIAVEAVDTKNQQLKEWLEEILKENYNCGDVVFEFSTDWENKNWSYIDHQSYGTVSGDVGSKNDLEWFIFGDQSRLIISNDN